MCMTAIVWTVTDVEKPWMMFIWVCISTHSVQRIAVVLQTHVELHLKMQSDSPSSVRRKCESPNISMTSLWDST